MIGLTTTRNKRNYKLPNHVILNINIYRQEFRLEGMGYISSFQKLKEGIEYQFTVAEFEYPSERISENNDFSEVDFEYTKMIDDKDLQLQFKLEEFHRLKAVLKEEGLIE